MPYGNCRRQDIRVKVVITKDSKNILIADDSEFFREKLKDILVEAGHIVRFAHNGKEAVSMIGDRDNAIDIVILDLYMPDSDGFSVLEWMKQSGCQGRPPVLVITGAYEPGQVLDRVKGLGAFGLMTKSFTKEQIVHRLNQMIFSEKDKQRIAPRVPVSIPATFSIGGMIETGQILNISETGVFLHAAKELLEGMMIQLSFTLPGTARNIKTSALVRWCTHVSGEKSLFGGAGVSFISLGDEDKDAFIEFIESEVKRLGKKEQGHGEAINPSKV
ncbi:MAG: response regulator [Deltaproteobacteria bacterium]|nr:response regulator [Deltaproteobacteria bacterium]